MAHFLFNILSKVLQKSCEGRGAGGTIKNNMNGWMTIETGFGNNDLYIKTYLNPNDFDMVLS